MLSGIGLIKQQTKAEWKTKPGLLNLSIKKLSSQHTGFSHTSPPYTPHTGLIQEASAPTNIVLVFAHRLDVEIQVCVVKTRRCCVLTGSHFPMELIHPHAAVSRGHLDPFSSHHIVQQHLCESQNIHSAWSLRSTLPCLSILAKLKTNVFPVRRSVRFTLCFFFFAKLAEVFVNACTHAFVLTVVVCKCGERIQSLKSDQVIF